MEIQSSTQGFSLDTFGSAGSQSGAKDDMFAQMIGRMMDASSAKRQENTQQADSRRAARSASQDDQAARAAEKNRTAKAAADKAAADRAAADRADADRADADRTDARTRLTAQTGPARPMAADVPAPRTTETERPVPARTDAGKPAADKTAAKPATKADSGTPADKPNADGSKAADAAPTDGKIPDATAAAPDADADADAQTDAAAATDDDDTVVIEAQVTIVETTVEVITPTQHLAMTLTQGAGTLSATADEGQAPDADAMAAKATEAMAGTQGTTGPTLPAGARPLPGPLDGKAPHLPADGKPEEVKADAATPGALPADALPTDDTVELPESIAGLFQNAGQGGAVKDAAAKGQGGAGGNPQGQQPQQQPFADPSALNAQTTATQTAAASTKTAFETVAAAAAADTAQPLAATHETAAADPAQAVMAPIDGVKTAVAEGSRATTVMHPSRGTAAMPQGVPDQISVNIQKAVKDGKDHFSIRLNPEDLGRIDIRLEIAQDGRLQANISVEKAQTLELLQRDQRSLESALNSTGLKADSDSLNFSLHSDGQAFAGENNAQDGNGRRGRGRGTMDADEQAEQDAAIIHTLTLGPGRFDVRV